MSSRPGRRRCSSRETRWKLPGRCAAAGTLSAGREERLLSQRISQHDHTPDGLGVCRVACERHPAVRPAGPQAPPATPAVRQGGSRPQLQRPRRRAGAGRPAGLPVTCGLRQQGRDSEGAPPACREAAGQLLGTRSVAWQACSSPAHHHQKPRGRPFHTAPGRARPLPALLPGPVRSLAHCWPCSRAPCGRRCAWPP